MIYKLGLFGASGRMGGEIAALLSAGFEFRGDFLELADAVAGSRKLTHLEGIEVRSWEDPPREPVHAWIDFSRPQGTLALLSKLESPVVIGTTGFNESEFKVIEQYASRYPVLLASNTSPGMNAMLRFLEECVPPATFPGDVVLSEEHHRHKKDAPSGTAKTLLQALKNSGRDNVQVHVTRAGNIPGVHTVKFISDEEEIEITHRVSSRTVFARGALWAARFLLKQKTPKVYSMREVFSEES